MASAEQDAGLEMLIAWIGHHGEREDELSLAAHHRLFDGLRGEKHELTSNDEACRLLRVR